MIRGRSSLLQAISVVLLPLAIASGCNDSGGKASVYGEVSFRGQPLEQAGITFFPDAGRPETTSVENGRYRVSLVPGNFTATVVIGPTLPPNFKEGDKIPPPKVLLPDGYSSRLKSPLKATVSSGQSEPINFDLK